MAVPQQYCLRWNNHRSNLLTVFDQLLQNEAFTDVTLACEGGASVKCHKMVLAACSSYFQCLFTELPCSHPVVVLKDVRYCEMKAILEYMYRGEVNVAQDQLAALLKVAEALKVKGLVEENTTKATTNSPPNSEEPNNTITTSTAANVSSNLPHSSNNNNNNSNNNNNESASPPHSTGIHQQSGFPKNPYNIYGKSPVLDRQSNRVSLPLWGVPGLPLPTPPPPALNSCYESAAAMFSSDMSPLRRKKLSSILMSRDTPILRTVLGQGQGQADSSQPVPLVCHPDSHAAHARSYSNGSGGAHETEKTVKMEQTSEDAHSPYTDISMMEEETERNNKMMLPSSSPQSIYSDVKGGVSSGIATYVPTQKPEWKRYKQYTRNDIMSAIEAVRTGMSALQAARKYGVPSRTLYDKVKKLGITTSRPFRRGSNGNGGVVFPYNLASGGGVMFTSGAGDEENSSYCGIEHGFLHQALESGGKVCMGGDRGGGAGGTDDTEREALPSNTVMTLSTGPGNSSSPNNNIRTPSPNLIKYAHRNSLTPSPPPSAQQQSSVPMDDEEDEDILQDQVEDLSVTRKPDPPPPTSRVIMPPMSQSTATLITTGGSDTHQDSRD
ncbi:uncharacterized protein LOC142332193 [Lycorma delicatula]|uniref:uncharacterized protein LOC142332193 n=1 Tax=Lycorma delicatula TaxID=130591 RepID=UPI003F51911D